MNNTSQFEKPAIIMSTFSSLTYPNVTTKSSMQPFDQGPISIPDSNPSLPATHGSVSALKKANISLAINHSCYIGTLRLTQMFIGVDARIAPCSRSMIYEIGFNLQFTCQGFESALRSGKHFGQFISRSLGVKFNKLSTFFLRPMPIAHKKQYTLFFAECQAFARHCV